MAGCSCGQCIGGIISPKAAYRLRVCAEVSSELLNETLPAFPGDQAVHDPEVYMFDYVPPELRMEVPKPFVLGFGNCMRSVAYLLRQGQLPKPRIVGQCASIVPGLDKSATKQYLDKGGMPEYALDAVLARCVEEHEQLGDGTFIQDEEHAKVLGALPACGNDDQFELVRQKLFENSDFWPCGPYGFDDQQDGNDEDGYVYYDTSNYYQ